MKLFFPSAVATLLLAVGSLLLPTSANPQDIDFYWPAEDLEHAATWLQWPHNRGWDPDHIARYEPSWIELTEALHTGEQVKIFVYNRREKRRVQNLLKNRGLDMRKIDLYIAPTDDVWIRDNGPIFSFDGPEGTRGRKMVVQDWGFNGWGRKADWWYDDYIPTDAAYELYLEDTMELVNMINEGGSIEVDGRGTFMGKRSSILNQNRNPGMSQAEAEDFFRRYLGVTNFIWLDGTPGLEITDDHIDGTARFANGNVIVTHSREDSWVASEYDILESATDANGQTYEIVHLPLTQNNVPGIDIKGLYINYYVANEVVIVPMYMDPNDDTARDVLQGLYPTKTMVQIDFRELYQDGGVVHCVTMQQGVP